MRPIDSLYEAIITAFIILLTVILVIGIIYFLKLFKKKSFKKSQVKRQQKHDFLMKACRQKDRGFKTASCPNAELISSLKIEDRGALSELPNNNQNRDDIHYSVEGIPLIKYGLRQKQSGQ